MAADETLLRPITTVHKTGYFLLLGSSFAAASANGFFFGHIELQTAIGISVVCGVIGGALFAHQRASLFVGAVCGLLCGIGGMVATYYWTRERSTVHSIEIVLAWIVGAVPGAMLFRTWAQSMADGDLPPGDFPPPPST